MTSLAEAVRLGSEMMRSMPASVQPFRLDFAVGPCPVGTGLLEWRTQAPSPWNPGLVVPDPGNLAEDRVGQNMSIGRALGYPRLRRE